MNAYYSRYVVTDYAFYPATPYKARGWTICFEDEPCDATYRSSLTFEGKTYPAKAVIIHAASRERAQQAADAIHASVGLMTGELPWFGQTVVIPRDPESAEHDDGQHDTHPGRDRVSGGDLPLACLIAVRASYRRAYQHALFKYALSCQTFPTSGMGLRPSGWWPARFVFDSAQHHVRCAYAIVLAYSVLEELSLELRASRDNPSSIGGKWNPRVKRELEARLEKAGIDLSETVLWILRDTPTRIERTRAARAQSRAEWAGLKVRDSEVAVVDAIAYTSWLRSRVSAHKLGDLAGSLSYYDVLNAQHLARRVLLERLGFWRYQERVRAHDAQ